MPKVRWLLTTGASLFSASVSAQPLPTVAEVNDAAQAAMRETGAKGLAIAVIDGGEVKHVAAFGARNAAGDPLTTDTIMYGASLTKAVFGYRVAMLADKSRIDLDKPLAVLLSRPLPEYGNLDAFGNWADLAGDERWRAITPRMALNHATGFANFAFLEPDGKLRIHFTPGSRYAYSGEGIMLLQFALEEGLGTPIGYDLASTVFTPLGMTRTSLSWRSDYAAILADGWKADGAVEPHDERSRARAAGSMDTTIADIARMTAAMVRGWGLSKAGHAAFSRGTLPITTRSQFPTLQAEAPPDQRPAAKAALGVIAFDGPQGPGWFKGGHNDSTANTVVCLTTKRRCVVILANDVRAEAAFPRLVRTILGETGVPYDWEYPELAGR